MTLNKMDLWEKDMSTIRCSGMNTPTGLKNTAPSRSPSVCAFDSYMIEVSFEAMEDEVERKHLESLPTTFRLEPSAVDRLKAAAKKTLNTSPVFQKLLSDLQ